ncbi:MAG: hypothetical protein 4 [Bactrocera dorsalis negev-like virus isolate Bc]|nr:hypothetical protein [Bactrocera dorsalis negev-like virus]UPT53671.1 MAG: hypothetical protein 4 [Bactrocera dorsalis negev-like virus isolate Bc]
MSFVNSANGSNTTLVTSVKSEPSIFENIFSAYGNLTNKPIALILFIVATLSLIAESNTQNGPFELIIEALKAYINEDHAAPLKSIVTLIIGLLNFLVLHKPTIFLILLIIVIPVTYPNVSPITLGLLLLYVIVTKSSTMVIFFVIQLTFVYFFLTNHWNKIFIFLIIVFLVFGVHSISNFFTKKE